MKQPSVSRRRVIAGAGACAVAASGSSVASGAASPPQSGPQPELETRVDELVAASLEEYDVPGATVAVVSGRGAPLTKGYGRANRERDTPVDSTTTFRVGSVSKPVVATALMNRVERGELDPTTPVSVYLDAPIRGHPGKPPTLEQLITHRGGFESTNRGLWIPESAPLKSLAAYLREEPHHQVREPGTVGSYSNFGYALAGQLLAATSDKAFAGAIADELLQPAGMTRSSFRQPLPDAIAEAHATSYGSSGSYAQASFPRVGLRPAGSLSTTAEDMARFLQLHLRDGILDGEQVLEPGTVAAMHEQWATHDERLDGMAFGFIEDEHGDTRTLWHNGATLSFYSELVIVPEHDFGVFVAFNTDSARNAATDIIDGLLDWALPEQTESTRTPDGTPTRAEELTGTYRSLQQSHTWHDALTSTLNAPTVEIHVADDGALVTDAGGTTSRWIEIAPLVFERTDGSRRLAFGERDGDIEYLYRGGSPTAFARIRTLDRLWLHGLFVLATVIGMLSTSLRWSETTLYQLLRDGDGAVSRRLYTALDDRTTRARLVARTAVTLLTGGLTLAFVHLSVNPLAVLSAPPFSFRVLFVGTVAGLVGTLASVGYAVDELRHDRWERGERVYYGLTTAALAGFCLFLWRWNLLFPPA
ncbi:serine hydrolase [Halosegnis longus]|uniref:serine hydrolase n=1 Tax=Halosegnis longus TaxID=2216012 RepID=UPI00096A97F1|nr:serine hydrolase domain-containing protein [Salella cibi]